MGALKSLVIGLGVMVVVAMGLLAWGLYHKANNPDFKLFETGTSQEEASGFGDLSVSAPKGCVIARAHVEDDLLVVLVKPSKNWFKDLGVKKLERAERPDCDRVVVIDMTTGATKGSVKLTVEP